MTTTLSPLTSGAINLHDTIKYPQSGVLSTVLLNAPHCQYILLCLAADTEISEHTSSRNATVHVLQGQGTLTLEGQPIALNPGLFVTMPAAAPHALRADGNLAILLTLSDAS